jgi:uncharacterized protein YqgC (DUF456 family)
MSKIALLILACAGCLAGVILSAVRLPGIWLIAGGAALMGWLSQWQLITGTAILWVLGLAVLAEILEFLLSAIVTRRAGGSRKAAWGSLIGGFAGLLFLSIPLPIIGSIIGALLGCFLGAAIGELSARGSLAHGTRVGVSAAIGFAIGTATKVAIAFIISIIVVTSLIKADRPRNALPVSVSPNVP